MTDRIAIIGAGPGGAIALDTFLKNGYEDITLFEQRRKVGGTWNLDQDLGFKPSQDVPGVEVKEANHPAPIPNGAEKGTVEHPVTLPTSNFGPRYDESPLYPQVETNVLADMMSFSEKPVPAVHPPNTKERFGRDDAYRSHTVVRDYVSSYFEGREKYLKLNTAVEKAYQVNGPGSKWKLVLREHDVGSDTEEWYTEEFDFLYAASGRFNVPYVPDIPGLKETAEEAAPNTIIHTKTFRDPSVYKNKKVVLIGASFSNVDVAHLIEEAGANLPLHLSLRNILPTSIRGFTQPWIEAHPTISRVQFDQNRKDKLTITFEDGETLNDVDSLVIGTGYQYSFPYLEEYLKPYGGITRPGGKGTTNLYWSTWWKYDASLVITSSITDSLFWRLLEAQARATANLWKTDRSTWPKPEESDEWEADRRSKDLYDFHIWYPHYGVILDGVAKVGGTNFGHGEGQKFNGLFEQSFGLKGDLWEKQAYQYLETHPENKPTFDKTKAFLTERVVTRF